MKQLFSMVLAMVRFRPRAVLSNMSKSTKRGFGVGLFFVLFIFSSVSVAQQTVALSVTATSDSEGITGMHYTVMRYANDKCEKAEKPRKLFRKKFASAKQSMGPMEIPVVDQFWFQINYQERRRGEERSCDFLLGFEPKEGRRYEAVLDVSGQVSACSLNLFDITNEPQKVTFSRPENSCKSVKKLGKPNGAPVHNSLKRF